MHRLALRRSVEKAFKRLAKKDKGLLELVFRKIEEIRINPHRFKNLRRPLQHLKRVHIGKSYVLVYSIDDEENLVIIEDFDHHDRIYRV